MDAGTAAVGLSIASAGFGASSNIAKGMGTQAADEAQAARLERAAEFGKLQAAGTDVTMREELNTTLGNIAAIRAAAGIDPTSPTTAAILERNTMVSDRQREAALLKIRSQTREDLDSAAFQRKAGEYALLQGYLGAGTGASGAVLQGLARPRTISSSSVGNPTRLGSLY